MNLQTILDSVERAGNRLPNPAMLFVYLCIIVLLVSAVCAALAVEVIHPLNGDAIAAVNLISAAGLHRILLESVTNFTQFAPVGTVLVAIMGVGIADHSGLLNVLLRATVLKAPRRFLTFIIVFAGVLSSLTVDTGYVVLIPLAGLVYAGAGLNPVAGIAAAFAGVSAGYSANILIGPIDALLGGISSEAASLIQPGYEVSAAANYYFMAASSLFLSLLGTWVTEKMVIPRLPAGKHAAIVQEQIADADMSGLKAVGIFTVVFVALLLAGLLPKAGVLRDPQTGGVLTSPFIKGIVTIIAFYAAAAGILFGRISGRYRRASEFVDGMEQSMVTMASYLVLMFFAAQFVNYFAWSNLGTIIAISGAEMLGQLQLHPSVLLLAFIPLVAFINLFIGSASAKWALIAPVFVPMFLLSGITPEATQIAYRVGDSSTNIITPLMPYFGVVVAFARQHDKTVGIGTIIAMMLPYSIAFLVSWSLFLFLWVLAGIPIGPGVEVFVPLTNLN